MPTNIEQLKTKVENTTNQIEQSEALSAAEKLIKAKELEKVIDDINTELEELKQNATQGVLDAIDALKSKISTLQDRFDTVFKAQLDDLKNTVQSTVTNTIPNNKEDEKSWLGRQIDGLISADEWKDHTGKNIARVAGGVGIVRLGSKVFKGIRSLFSSKEKSDGDDKGFWDKWYGKAIKYAGIGIGGFLGIKWLMDYFTDKTDKTDDTTEQINQYETLPEDQIEKYEGVGDNINNFYKNIRQREGEMGYQDMNYLGTISENVTLKQGEESKSHAGLVPYCIDQDSDNIGDFLGEGELNEYIFSKNYKELKLKLKDWSTDKLEGLLGPYIQKLESFQVFGTNPGKSLGENIRDWLYDDQEIQKKQKELEFFFRQYSKVLTYMQDRKTLLEYKIAEDILKKKGYDGDNWPNDREDQLEMIEESIDDKDRFNDNISNNPIYKQFLSSNILGSHQVLLDQGLLNDQPSEILSEEIVKPIDEETEDILKLNGKPPKSIIDVGLGEIDMGLSLDTKEDLLDSCDDLKEDMIDETGTGILQTHMEWFAYAINMDDSNKEIFLQNTGLDKFSKKYIDTLNGIKEKIADGSITKQDLENLKKTATEYLAFKKELALAMYTFGEIRSDNPEGLSRAFNTVLMLFQGLGVSLSNIFSDNRSLGDFIDAGIRISVIGTGVYIIRHPRRTGKKILIGTVRSGLYLTKFTAKRTVLNGMRVRELVNKANSVAEKKSLIKHYLYNGEFNLSKTKNRRLVSDVFSLGEDISSKTPGQIIELIEPNIQGYGEQISKYSNQKNLRKLFLDKSVNGDAKWTDQLFYKKSNRFYNFDTKVLRNLKSIDGVIHTSPKYADKISKLLKHIKTKDALDGLELLVKDEGCLNKIKDLNRTQFRKLAKEIGRKGFSVDHIDEVLDDVLDKIPARLIKDIDGQLSILKKTQSVNGNHEKYIKKQIDDLGILKNKLLKNEDGIVSTYKALNKSGMKPLSIVEILHLKKINSSAFEKLINQRNTDNMVKYLKTLDVKNLRFDNSVKSLEKCNFSRGSIRNIDEFVGGFKRILKIVAKAT